MKGSADFGKASVLPFFMLFRRLLGSLLLITMVWLSGCSDYPKDMGNTLDDIRREGVLRVGVVENPPWVIRGEADPEGVEPSIVRNLANTLNAEVRWHWGSTAAVIHALEQHQLDLVIGGLTSGPRLPKTVAATKPYFNSHYTVGFQPSLEDIRRDLEGQPVAVPVLSPLHQVLRDKNADPQPMKNPEQSALPMAGPTWELRAKGYIPSRWRLLTEKQVMVVARGENAWLLLLQRHLNKLDGVEERLEQVGGQG